MLLFFQAFDLALFFPYGAKPSSTKDMPKENIDRVEKSREVRQSVRKSEEVWRMPKSKAGYIPILRLFHPEERQAFSYH